MCEKWSCLGRLCLWLDLFDAVYDEIGWSLVRLSNLLCFRFNFVLVHGFVF